MENNYFYSVSFGYYDEMGNDTCEEESCYSQDDFESAKAHYEELLACPEMKYSGSYCELVKKYFGRDGEEVEIEYHYCEDDED